MKIIRWTKKKHHLGRHRYRVTLYLDEELDWEKLRKHDDVLYDNEVFNYPIIRLPSGTMIRFQRKSVQIWHPKFDEIPSLIAFAWGKIKVNPYRSGFYSFMERKDKQIEDMEIKLRVRFGREVGDIMKVLKEFFEDGRR